MIATSFRKSVSFNSVLQTFPTNVVYLSQNILKTEIMPLVFYNVTKNSFFICGKPEQENTFQRTCLRPNAWLLIEQRLTFVTIILSSLFVFFHWLFGTNLETLTVKYHSDIITVGNTILYEQVSLDKC